MSPGIMRPMIDMLSPAGEARLAQALAGRPLLALDFDGTVSRLVPDPETARMDPAVPPLLTRLATRMPVALVSGRGLQDLRARTPLTGLTLWERSEEFSRRYGLPVMDLLRPRLSLPEADSVEPYRD